MLMNKELKYILMFSGFAFFSSILLGLISGLHVSTIIFRAFLQVIVFFSIGLFVGFIYKKYLKDLFLDAKPENFDFASDDMIGKDENFQLNSELDNGGSFDTESSNDNFDLLDEIKKYREHESNPSKEEQQVEHIKENNPKIVADAIRTIMNNKE